MHERLNQPMLQSGLVAWGAVCMFGVLLGVKLMFDSLGTDHWQASTALIALCVLGWFALAGIAWSQQRELAFAPGVLHVRRWTDVLFGRPGRRIALSGPVRARIFVGSHGYSAAKIEAGSETLKFPLTLWPHSEAQRLPEVLERHGATVEIGGSVFD